MEEVSDLYFGFHKSVIRFLLFFLPFSGFILIFCGFTWDLPVPPDTGLASNSYHATQLLTNRLCYHRSNVRPSYPGLNLLQNVPIRPFNCHITINIHQLKTKPVFLISLFFFHAILPSSEEQLAGVTSWICHSLRLELGQMSDLKSRQPSCIVMLT